MTKAALVSLLLYVARTKFQQLGESLVGCALRTSP